MSSEKFTARESIVALIKKLHPYRFEKGLIRVGPNRDGGYLVPNDLEGIHSCFSPGVGDCSEFELWCFNHGIEIFLADGSIDRPALDIDSTAYNFLKKFVGKEDNEQFISMNSWVQSNVPNPNCDLLLQMDIEGGEYESLSNTSHEVLNRFRVMVIEFHDLDRLWQPKFFLTARSVFEKILETHYCIHIHPNNYIKIHSRSKVDIPPVAEFTFIKKDRTKSRQFETRFPHQFDFDNASTLPTMVLPHIWHKKRWWPW